MKKFRVYLLDTQATIIIICADRVCFDPDLTRFQIHTDGQYERQYESKAVFATKNIIGWEEVK